MAWASFIMIWPLAFLPTVHAAETTEPREGSVELARTWHYRPVRDVALEVIRQYPPDQFHYVGVGRGPTVFMAMIQALLGTSAATNLPLSYLRNLQPPNPRVIGAPEGEFDAKVVGRETTRARTYTTKILSRFHAHLRHFLPGVGNPEATKTILFIDFADSGVSLINLKRELDGHNASLPPEQRRAFAYLGLTHGRDGVSDRLTAAGVHTLRLTGRALYVVQEHLYKHLAEYSFWSVSSTETRIPEPNTRAVKRRLLRSQVTPQLHLNQPHDRDVRKLRRDLIRRYRTVEDYYGLVDAYVRRARTDVDLSTAASSDVSIEARVHRLAGGCQTRLDRTIDRAYQILRRK